MAGTLREQRRQEMTEAILRSARRQLETAGVEGVTLREVARDIGIAVSALYRYVDDRDDLITELLVEAFTDHADAVDAAVDAASPGDVRGAIVAAFRAYRSWSVENPAQFGLAFGAPVPGYHAPAGRTIAVAVRPGGRVMALFAQAYAAGLVDPDVLARRESLLDEGTSAGFEALAQRQSYPLPAPAVALAVDAFVRVHGFTVMEVFGQLRPLVSPADAYFDTLLSEIVANLGL
ncbi:TetR/AcrR family transcriptional regulator [Cellulomonas sp. URHD0024]|uniref:TetR/AcrR family transcriptional regulator n=1 Tax=Cellulomonas sp. URHD0024 TaxID=1302620 RepID=UPI00040E6976|nr:TetR/AcrR family transcriptional regulator [Cellulomonas sp. URHD0024]